MTSLGTRLGFQPNGLSDFPLYSEKSLDCVVLVVVLPFVVADSDEFLDGNFGGPAIVRASDILILALMLTRTRFPCPL